MEKKFKDLLNDNTIEKRLEDNKEYTDNLLKLDFGFYLLKKYIPENKVNILFKYDEINEYIKLTEEHEYFREGCRQAGL